MSHFWRAFLRAALPAWSGLVFALGVHSSDAAAAEHAPVRPSLKIEHVHDMGQWFGLGGVQVTLDDAPLASVAGRPELSPGTVLDVSSGPLAPGRRTLDITVLYEGRSDLFTYLQDYRFRMRARLTLEIRPSYSVEVRTIAHERPELALEWQERPRLIVEVVPRAAVVNVELFPLDHGPLEEQQGQTPSPTPKPQVKPPPVALQPPAPACEARVIGFDSGDTRLRPEAEKALREVAACLPRGGYLRLTGHADVRGEGTVNMPLGYGRAQSAAGFLRGLGLGPRQLEVKSEGAEQPLCFGHEDTCHRRNRRVEVVPVKPEPDGTRVKPHATP